MPIAVNVVLASSQQKVHRLPACRIPQDPHPFSPTPRSSAPAPPHLRSPPPNPGRGVQNLAASANWRSPSSIPQAPAASAKNLRSPAPNPKPAFPLANPAPKPPLFPQCYPPATGPPTLPEPGPFLPADGAPYVLLRIQVLRSSSLLSNPGRGDESLAASATSGRGS